MYHACRWTSNRWEFSRKIVDPLPILQITFKEVYHLDDTCENIILELLWLITKWTCNQHQMLWPSLCTCMDVVKCNVVSPNKDFIHRSLNPTRLKTFTVFTREQSASFELSFELRILNDHSKYGIFDRVYAKLHRDASFEMRISNDGPEVFSSSRKSRSEINVWMPWPVNCDLGGGA